jgi:hypothetical protein
MLVDGLHSAVCASRAMVRGCAKGKHRMWGPRLCACIHFFIVIVVVVAPPAAAAVRCPAGSYLSVPCLTFVNRVCAACHPACIASGRSCSGPGPGDCVDALMFTPGVTVTTWPSALQ